MNLKKQRLLAIAASLLTLILAKPSEAQFTSLFKQATQRAIQHAAQGDASYGWWTSANKWELNNRGEITIPESTKPAPIKFERVSIPFSAATLNTFLRPSDVDEVTPWYLGGFVPLGGVGDFVYDSQVFATNVDNHERAEIVKQEFGKFDIVALQEVFDADQDWQFRSSRSHQKSNGPGQDRLPWYLGGGKFGSNSGLVSLVTNDFRIMDTYRYEFENEGGGSDQLANKGFLVQRIQLDDHPLHYVYVVNTHLHSTEPATRKFQLKEIYEKMKLIKTHPIIFLGDFNVRATDEIIPPTYSPEQSFAQFAGMTLPSSRFEIGELDYSQMLRIFGNLIDPFFIEKNRNGGDFDTSNRNRNPYGYFFGGPTTQKPGRFKSGRVDYILIKQGTQYQVRVESVRLEDGTDANPRDIETSLIKRLRERTQIREYFGEGKLSNFYSDHFGLSAELVFENSGSPLGDPVTNR